MEKCMKMDCLGEGTKIRMCDGRMVAIENIRIGDIVAVMNGQTRVMNIWRGREDSYFAIRFGNTLLNTSSDHLLLTADGWKRAYNLKCGDQLKAEFDGYVPVTFIKKIDEVLSVYNLSYMDESDPTMFAQGVVVGNMDLQDSLKI